MGHLFIYLNTKNFYGYKFVQGRHGRNEERGQGVLRPSKKEQKLNIYLISLLSGLYWLWSSIAIPLVSTSLDHKEQNCIRPPDFLAQMRL